MFFVLLVRRKVRPPGHAHEGVQQNRDGPHEESRTRDRPQGRLRKQFPEGPQGVDVGVAEVVRRFGEAGVVVAGRRRKTRRLRVARRLQGEAAVFRERREDPQEAGVRELLVVRREAQLAEAVRGGDRPVSGRAPSGPVSPGSVPPPRDLRRPRVQGPRLSDRRRAQRPVSQLLRRHPRPTALLLSARDLRCPAGPGISVGDGPFPRAPGRLDLRAHRHHLRAVHRRGLALRLQLDERVRVLRSTIFDERRSHVAPQEPHDGRQPGLRLGPLAGRPSTELAPGVPPVARGHPGCPAGGPAPGPVPRSRISERPGRPPGQGGVGRGERRVVPELRRRAVPSLREARTGPASPVALLRLPLRSASAAPPRGRGPVLPSALRAAALSLQLKDPDGFLNFADVVNLLLTIILFLLLLKTCQGENTF